MLIAPSAHRGLNTHADPIHKAHTTFYMDSSPEWILTVGCMVLSLGLPTGQTKKVVLRSHRVRAFLWVKHPGSPVLCAEGKFFGNFRKVQHTSIPWLHRPPAQLKKGENMHESTMMNHCPYTRVTSRSCLPNRCAIFTPQVTETARLGTHLDAWHF